MQNQKGPLPSRQSEKSFREKVSGAGAGARVVNRHTQGQGRGGGGASKCLAYTVRASADPSREDTPEQAVGEEGREKREEKGPGNERRYFFPLPCK